MLFAIYLIGRYHSCRFNVEETVSFEGASRFVEFVRNHTEMVGRAHLLGKTGSQQNKGQTMVLRNSAISTPPSMNRFPSKPSL